MKERQYTILLEPDVQDGGYAVTVPALPGCHTQGESMDEAIAMAKDAIACWIASAKKNGEPVPEETRHPQAIILTVAA